MGSPAEPVLGSVLTVAAAWPTVHRSPPGVTIVIIGALTVLAALARIVAAWREVTLLSSLVGDLRSGLPRGAGTVSAAGRRLTAVFPSATSRWVFGLAPTYHFRGGVRWRTRTVIGA